MLPGTDSINEIRPASEKWQQKILRSQLYTSMSLEVGQITLRETLCLINRHTAWAECTRWMCAVGSPHCDTREGTSSYDTAVASVTSKHERHERPGKRLHVVASNEQWYWEDAKNFNHFTPGSGQRSHGEESKQTMQFLFCTHCGCILKVVKWLFSALSYISSDKVIQSFITTSLHRQQLDCHLLRWWWVEMGVHLI